MSSKTVKDHLGREYPSMNAMCKAYNQPHNTVRNRLSRGWSLEEALTIMDKSTTKRRTPKKIWTDHLGNKYPSVNAMCKQYNISEKVFWSRKRICKWPLEKILTTPVQTNAANSKQITDHLSNTFDSISDLCRFHGIGRSTFKERLKLGMSIEEALTRPKKDIKIEQIKCKDHLGKEYPSLNAMCKAYGLSRYTYSSRLNLGWDQEKALTTPYVINNKNCVDYQGQTFPTLKDMANYYMLPLYTFQGINDLNANMIIKKIKSRFANYECDKYTVIKCIKFPYFIVSKKGKSYIMNFDDILYDFHNSDLFQPLPQTKIDHKEFEIIKRIQFPYYLVKYQNKEYTWSYWDIIEYNKNSNFGLLKNKGDETI